MNDFTILDLNIFTDEDDTVRAVLFGTYYDEGNSLVTSTDHYITGYTLVDSVAGPQEDEWYTTTVDRRSMKVLFDSYLPGVTARDYEAILDMIRKSV